MSSHHQPPDLEPPSDEPPASEGPSRWLPREGAASTAASLPSPGERAPAEASRPSGAARLRGKARKLGGRVALPLWGIAAASLLLVGALVVAVALALESGKEGAGAPEATAPSASTSPEIDKPSAIDEPKATSPPRRVPNFQTRPTRDPFLVDGVRWAVFVDPQQSWTRFARRVSPGPGQRWLLVAVRTRNLSRENFDPRVLDYQVLGADRRAYFPSRRFGTGKRLGRPPVPLATDETGQSELAFRVPKGSDYTLLFNAGRGSTGRPTQVLLNAG